VRQSPAGSMPLEQALTVEYDDKALQAQLGQLETRALKGDDLVAFGRLLGQLLLPSDPQSGHGVRDLFARSIAMLGPDQGLRLKLQLPAALALLPWEYIYVDRAGGGDGKDGFLTLDRRVAIVRHEDLPAPPRSPLAPQQTKMIVALASAPGFTSLNLAKERADLEQALQALPSVTPIYLDDAALDELQAAIVDAGVFHFAGHGVFTQQMGDQPGVYTGVGQLAFDDQRVDATDLGILLRGAGVRLAVLGGCETGRRDGVSVWSGTAPALIKAEIPAVVANQFKVLDTCAIAFSKQFYQALLVGGLSIEQAVSAGRIAAYMVDREGRDWGAPVLYMRAADGRLFGGGAEEEPRRKAVQEAEELLTTVIDTGGGAYIDGNVDTGGGAFTGRDSVVHGDVVKGDKVGGDKVEGDKIVVGNISGVGIAIGREAQATVHQGLGGDELARLFATVYQRIDARPESANVDKAELRSTVRRVQQEAAKGEQASPGKVERWLTILAEMAPDILEVTVASLLSPAAGIAAVIRNVADRARRGGSQ